MLIVSRAYTYWEQSLRVGGMVSETHILTGQWLLVTFMDAMDGCQSLYKLA